MLTLFHPAKVQDGDNLVRDLAIEVAQIARTRLTTPVSGMSVAELRGYVRTRAAAVAKTQVRQATAERRLSHDNEHDMIAVVLERAIHLVIRDLLVQPVVSIPAPHVRLRIAA
jgi:hypothetical protein